MSENPTNLDPLLLGLLNPDEAFRQAARNFVGANGQPAYTEHLRPQLANFSEAYYRTSQDFSMNAVLLSLHDMYNLNGLVDPRLLSFIQHSELVLRENNQSPYPPLPTPEPSEPLLSQNLPLGTLNQEARNDSSNMFARSDSSNFFTLVDPSLEDAVTMREAVTEDSESHPTSHTPANLINSRPKGRVRTIIEAMDKRWMYRCDLCNHPKRYRNEFHRHFSAQPIRAGFKVIRTNTSQEPYTWEAVDDAGETYSGKLELVGEGPVKRVGRIPPPCGKGNNEEVA